MEKRLLDFISNYKGDFYHDFPVVLEMIRGSKDNLYKEFRLRYSGAAKITEESRHGVNHITIITNLGYILENGEKDDLNYISKYYES